MISEKELEIFEHNGADYDPTMHFGTWRVALLNYAERFDEKNFNMVERHFETDEVFVLLWGEGTLVVGEELDRVVMETGKIYNVKAGVWHQILVSRDAKVLIVENDNTVVENSEYKKV